MRSTSLPPGLCSIPQQKHAGPQGGIHFPGQAASHRKIGVDSLDMDRQNRQEPPALYHWTRKCLFPARRTPNVCQQLRPEQGRQKPELSHIVRFWGWALVKNPQKLMPPAVIQHRRPVCGTQHADTEGQRRNAQVGKKALFCLLLLKMGENRCISPAGRSSRTGRKRPACGR